MPRPSRRLAAARCRWRCRSPRAPHSRKRPTRRPTPQRRLSSTPLRAAMPRRCAPCSAPTGGASCRPAPSTRKTSTTSSAPGRSSTRSCSNSRTRPLLAAGDGDWTLPVPIVKSAAGWRFDPQSGRRRHAQPSHRAQRTRRDAGRAGVLRRAEGIRAEGPRRQWRARVRTEVRERARQARRALLARRHRPGREPARAALRRAEEPARATTAITSRSSRRRARTRRAAPTTT